MNTFSLSLSRNELVQVHTATYCTGVYNIRASCASVYYEKKASVEITYYLYFPL